MSQLDKVLYTAKTHTTGGREGASRSLDGRLDVKLSRPGAAGTGTNPEQLFAAGWSACFLSAMQVVAGRMKILLPPDAAVDAEVDLGPVGDAACIGRARTSSKTMGSNYGSMPWCWPSPQEPDRNRVSHRNRLSLPSLHPSTFRHAYLEAASSLHRVIDPFVDRCSLACSRYAPESSVFQLYARKYSRRIPWILVVLLHQ